MAADIIGHHLESKRPSMRQPVGIRIRVTMQSSQKVWYAVDRGVRRAAQWCGGSTPA